MWYSLIDAVYKSITIMWLFVTKSNTKQQKYLRSDENKVVEGRKYMDIQEGYLNTYPGCMFSEVEQ